MNDLSKDFDDNGLENQKLIVGDDTHRESSSLIQTAGAGVASQAPASADTAASARNTADEHVGDLDMTSRKILFVGKLPPFPPALRHAVSDSYLHGPHHHGLRPKTRKRAESADGRLQRTFEKSPQPEVSRATETVVQQKETLRKILVVVEVPPFPPTLRNAVSDCHLDATPFNHFLPKIRKRAESAAGRLESTLGVSPRPATPPTSESKKPKRRKSLLRRIGRQLLKAGRSLLCCSCTHSI